MHLQVLLVTIDVHFIDDRHHEFPPKTGYGQVSWEVSKFNHWPSTGKLEMNDMYIISIRFLSGWRGCTPKLSRLFSACCSDLESTLAFSTLRSSFARLIDIVGSIAACSYSWTIFLAFNLVGRLLLHSECLSWWKVVAWLEKTDN